MAYALSGARCRNEDYKEVKEHCTTQTEKVQVLNFVDEVNMLKDEFPTVHTINQFSVDETIVIPASSVRNIGVMFDNTMSMKNQVTSLCKAAHFHLRNIGRIRKSITYEACEKLIHALITSRLDYCNATLYGVTDGQHQRLQKMFNTAVRILTLTPPSEDIETVLLETLHWLPVEQLTQYKILLLTFKVLHGLAPQYLSELLKLQVTERDTRQTDTNRLHQPVMNTRTLGDRAFVAAAPTL